MAHKESPVGCSDIENMCVFSPVMVEPAAGRNYLSPSRIKLKMRIDSGWVRT